MPPGSVNTADAKGLTFECKPGCGFCCTASPLVLPHEARPLGPLGIRIVRDDDGTLHIPLSGPACSALQADRRCGVYETRPSVCHLYPFAVHAGRRIQVTVTLACPGIERWHVADMPDTDGDFVAHPFGVANHAEDGAARAAELALAQPGAREMAAKAKETFTEFDRRMKEWGVNATPDKLRAAFLPAISALSKPANLAPFLAGVEDGDLLADPRAVAALFETETEAHLLDLYTHGASEAFDEPETVIWVEPDFAWTRVGFEEGRILLRRSGGEGDRSGEFDPASLPVEWADGASSVLARYLTRLLHRDHAEGAAAWLVDASGYQATPAAAYARVIAEASLQVALRSALLAADDGLDTIDEAHARRGVTAYETAFHSLPTLGSIL